MKIHSLRCYSENPVANIATGFSAFFLSLDWRKTTFLYKSHGLTISVLRLEGIFARYGMQTKLEFFRAIIGCL
jgi:hypothetical protein